MITVTLMAEWRDGPLLVARDGEVGDTYLPSEIGEVVELSGELRRDIDAWDGLMQDTYVADDPVRSGFADPEDQERFISHGRELARRIKREVGPTIAVEYAGDGSIPTELLTSDRR